MLLGRLWFSVSACFFALCVAFGPSALAESDVAWKDPVTGKKWLFLSQSLSWSAANEGCQNLYHSTEISPYRLPTLGEWWDVYDRIKDTDLADQLQMLHLQVWSGEKLPGTNPELIWTLFLQSGNAGGLPSIDLAAAACISVD